MDSTIHSDLIRGHIDTIILKALYDGDRYGFDIIKEIEQKSSGQYILKQPTLYSCLKRLEVQGFIKSYWGSKSNGGRRKYYTLTDMGRDLFIKNQSEWVYSRTVIDKLISDRDFDFASAVRSDEERLQEHSATSENQYDEISEETFEREEDLQEQSNESSADTIEEETNDEFDKQTLERENDYIEQKEHSANRDYVDTTVIMNEMLEMQTDGSYAEKVRNERYEPTESLDPESYFAESYFDDIPAAKAVPDDAPQTDDLIPRFVTRTYSEEAADDYEENNDSESAVSQDEEPKRPEFYSYDSHVPQADENAIVINREYKNILCELRDSNIVDNSNRKASDTAETASPVSNEETENLGDDSESGDENNLGDTETTHELLSNENIRIRNFEKLESDVKDLGDGVKIRNHSNNAAKEYASAYYFYSNKLMLSHYLVLFILMLLEVSITFFAIRLGSPTVQKNALPFYIIAIVVALAFPLTAFILNLVSPDKKKRVTFNFRISMIFRFVVMIEALVLIYTVNIMMGMPLTFGPEYLVTLLVPAIMTTNIPVSAVIFNSLYKSGKYRIEE